MFDEKPKRDVDLNPKQKRRIIRWIVLGLAGFFGLPVCACIACVAAIFIITQPIVDTSNEFFADLESEDYDAAYEQLTEQLQEEVGSPEQLEALIADYDGHPDRWDFINREVDDETGGLEGSITTQSGTEYPISVDLEMWDDEWRISRVQYGDFLIEP